MAYARTSERAGKRALRETMRDMGLSHREIAAELARRYRSRPRAAWREARGWSLKDAAEQINAHSAAAGLDPGGTASMSGGHLSEYENWPGPGAEPAGRKPTARLLVLLADVYGCAVTDLVDLADRQHLTPADLLLIDRPAATAGGSAGPAPAPPPSQALAVIPPAPEPGAQAGAGLAVLIDAIERYQDAGAFRAAPSIAYRGLREPAPGGGSRVGREVLMAAHDGSEHAERAEQRDIGDATLEQLRSDVVRLSHDYMTAEPFTLFQEMRRVRARMYAALDRRLWPRDESDLYFLLGCLNCLMAGVSDDLGYPQASEELLRAAWAYAIALDHRPLMAKLRTELSGNAYWHNRLRESRDLADSGLRYMTAGQTAAQLHLMYGRSAALMGDTDAARRAIGEAQEARDLPVDDDLLEIGGEFGLSRASQQFFVGSILLEIPAGERDAVTELERAVDMYAAGPGPGEDHGFGIKMITQINLALAMLRAGEIEGARPALGPVLALPPAMRIDPLPQRLEKVRAELDSPRYQGSPQASELDQEIEAFGRDTIVGTLSALAG
jgi:hypothetical protein